MVWQDYVLLLLLGGAALFYYLRQKRRPKKSARSRTGNQSNPPRAFSLAAVAGARI